MAFVPKTRVAQLPGINGFRANNVYYGANPSEPAGSPLMTFFSIFTLKRIPISTESLFGRAFTGGYYQYFSNNLLQTRVTNGSVANVIAPVIVVTPSNVGAPLIYISRYNGVPNPGNLEAWLDGISPGATTLGTGYTPESHRVSIGNIAGGIQVAPDVVIHECGMLYNFDVASTVAEVTAQWKEDLQHGRPPTWPRTAVSGQDWLWSARDACLGQGGTALTWTDRYSGVPVTRVGSLQSASVPARFSS